MNNLPSLKLLGVIIYEWLKWKNQYISLTEKLAGGVSSLKILKDVLPQSKLCEVYRATFESHLSHRNVVWGSLSSAELQTPQRLQNRPLSIIESARFMDLWPKNWLNVENLIRFYRSAVVYKILIKLWPESLWNMLQLRSSLSNYDTKNDKDRHIPKTKFEFSKKGFRYVGIGARNDIQIYVRELPWLSLFKSHLKRHLMSNENYFTYR